jgi:uncharacterized cupredoxin-like copper-binding protein
LLGGVAVALLAACGDDDDSTAPTTVVKAPATTAAGTAAGSGPGTTQPVPNDVCALAKQIDEQEDLPTAAQLQKYKELAPDEIKGDVNKAADALLAAGDDTIAKFNALGNDDVEAAIVKIDAFETKNCGIEHEEDELPPGTTKEKEDGAQQVTVTGREYSFDMPTDVKAGRTTFTLDNKGQEAHVLVIFKLGEGVTLDQAMQSNSGEGVEGQWGSDIAARGETEELTFDLTPGNYGAICFVPDAQGQPHFMLGMQKEFTVA